MFPEFERYSVIHISGGPVVSCWPLLYVCGTIKHVVLKINNKLLNMNLLMQLCNCMLAIGYLDFPTWFGKRSKVFIDEKR